MDISNVKNRLSVLLIGSYQFEDYNFKHLYGVKRDLESIQEILFTGEMALYNGVPFKILENPKLSKLENYITDFVHSKSVEKDILLLYYSGHGAIINGLEFGFVCNDTRIYDRNKQIIPTSIFSSKSLFNSLAIANVVPILIVDSCHSALINPRKLINSSWEAINNLKDEIHGRFASDFVLFSACANDEYAGERSSGGFFSQSLLKIANKKHRKYERKPTLSINDIYQMIISEKLKDSDLRIEPRLFFGHGFSDFPLIKNTSYKPIIIRLDNYKLEILENLWNEGQPKTFSSAELDELLGKGAYANNKKLTYKAWDLASKDKNNISLSEKGIKFMKGEIKIPDTIYKDNTTNGEYEPHPNAKIKSYQEFRQQLLLF
jgi:hypothetical protein